MKLPLDGVQGLDEVKNMIHKLYTSLNIDQHQVGVAVWGGGGSSRLGGVGVAGWRGGGGNVERGWGGSVGRGGGGSEG